MAHTHYFLYYLTLNPPYHDPLKWTEYDHQIISEHAKFLDQLGEKGFLAFAGRTDFGPGHDHLFGIALLKANSLAEAMDLMAADPAVKHGIQKAEIFPFRMSLPHFQNLL